MKPINLRANYVLIDPENWDANPIVAEVVVRDEKQPENHYAYVFWTLSGGLDFRAYQVPMYDLLCSFESEPIREAIGMLSYNFEIRKDEHPRLFKKLMTFATESALPLVRAIAKENELIETDDEIETLL